MRWNALDLEPSSTVAVVGVAVVATDVVVVVVGRRRRLGKVA
jgi:hypothetical protein